MKSDKQTRNKNERRPNKNERKHVEYKAKSCKTNETQSNTYKAGSSTQKAKSKHYLTLARAPEATKGQMLVECAGREIVCSLLTN